MIISSYVKIQRTINNNRKTLNNLRSFWESENIDENIKTLSPNESVDISCAKGICIITDREFNITGDLTITCDKVFFTGTALDITILHPVTETEDMELTFYTW